ncbi:MAG: tRNA pseudouridine(38-40) synthase TruA [Nocardioidaceae bacterium]|nr:tRNA pseudouridine(38-40) synthase TruA [Nocardioidaceae bacterium]
MVPPTQPIQAPSIDQGESTAVAGQLVELAAQLTVRLRLDVAYDGTDFSGWASQPGRRTVQSSLEEALAMVLRIPQPKLTVAGRTDAGVHARGQVCHVDLPHDALGAGGPRALTRRLARLLPTDLRVVCIAPVPDNFDARFSAVWRRYAYRVCDNPAAADPLTRNHVLVWPRHLDEKAMNAAAQHLLGEHDFAAFCKRRQGATTIRTLRELAWSREGDSLTARVIADAFCQRMVRSLVGCLIAVGERRQLVDWPLEVLSALRRDPGVFVVPARGLALEEVGYPGNTELGTRAWDARAVRGPKEIRADACGVSDLRPRTQT